MRGNYLRTNQSKREWTAAAVRQEIIDLGSGDPSRTLFIENSRHSPLFPCFVTKKKRKKRKQRFPRQSFVKV